MVLQYHHISDTTPASTSISPALFKQHMQYLADNDFVVVALPDLVKKLRQGETLPDKTVVITFDDAFASVYETAYPLLKKYQWPFTVFVNSEPSDKQQKLFVSWPQIAEMAKHGATIANHTTRHHHLLRLDESETRAEWQQRITTEILGAEKRIQEKTGQAHRILAYPYGEYDTHVQMLLKNLNFVGLGQQSGPLSAFESLQALPRFSFGGRYGDLKDFSIKVNSLPMPLQKVQGYADMELKQPLTDVVLPYGQRPVLVLTLEDKNLLKQINCFASGQGAIATGIRGKKLLVMANKALLPGRTRYNCTAASDQQGRFYWYSRQWLSKGKDGSWAHEPGL